MQIVRADKKGHAYYQVANAFAYMDHLDSVNFYIDIAIDDLRVTDNKRLLSGSLVFKGQNAILMGSNPGAMRLYKEAKSIMIAENDTNRLVDLYRRLGGLATAEDRLDEAMTDLENCYDLCISSGDREYEAYALNGLAVSHTKLGNTKKGLEMAYKALEIGKAEVFEFTKYQAYNNIGILYKNSGEYKKALKIYEKAEQLGLDINFKRGVMGVLANKGILFNLM